eukprot:scaffold116389_cov36-Tisochrysis_lutea.AAC.2
MHQRFTVVPRAAFLLAMLGLHGSIIPLSPTIIPLSPINYCDDAIPIRIRSTHCTGITGCNSNGRSRCERA